MKEKWPKDLYRALLITHCLFLDFGSFLHPLAGGRRAGGRWDGTRSAGTGARNTTGGRGGGNKEAE